MRRLLVLVTTLALLTAVPAGASAPESACVPTNGGDLDHHSEACVDAGERGCRTWHMDRHGQVTCYVPV